MTLTPPRLDGLQALLGLAFAALAAWQCWGWEWAVLGLGVIIYVDARWFDRAVVAGDDEDRSITDGHLI